MRADLRPLGRIEKTLEQGAENRGVDFGPLHRPHRDEQAQIPFVERQCSLAVEKTAVEICDELVAYPSALRRHGGKHVVEQGFGMFVPVADIQLLEGLAKKSLGQKLHVLREKAEDELHDEMRRGLRQMAARLKALRQTRELIGRLLGEHFAGHVPALPFRIVEDRVQDLEFFRVGEIVQSEIERFRQRVRPGRHDPDRVGVADHIQRRMFEVPGILRQLSQSLAEVFPFLFVLECEVTLLPDIGEAGLAGGFERAFLEAIVLARRIVLYRGRMVDEAAEIDEMLLRRLPFGERDGLPFFDELMRGHAEGLARAGGKLREGPGAFRPLISRRCAGPRRSLRQTLLSAPTTAKMPMLSLGDFAHRKLAELDRELQKEVGACQIARENRSGEA